MHTENIVAIRYFMPIHLKCETLPNCGMASDENMVLKKKHALCAKRHWHCAMFNGCETQGWRIYVLCACTTRLLIYASCVFSRHLILAFPSCEVVKSEGGRLRSWVVIVTSVPGALSCWHYGWIWQICSDTAGAGGHPEWPQIPSLYLSLSSSLTRLFLRSLHIFGYLTAEQCSQTVSPNSVLCIQKAPPSCLWCSHLKTWSLNNLSVVQIQDR